MADMNWNNATLFMRKEATEGTVNAPGASHAILAKALKPVLQRDWHARKFQGTYGERAGVIGAQRSPGFSFVTELKGNGSDNTPEIDELLENAFGAVSAGGASTTINGSGSTTTSLVVASSAGMTAGNMVNVQLTAGGVFEVAMISDVPDGTHITVTPALSAAPANTCTVDEMRTYQPAVPPAGVNSLSSDIYYNADAGASQYDRFLGCRCAGLSIKSPGAGAIPEFAFNFAAWNWTQALDGSRPTPTYDSTGPKSGLASKFKINATLTDMFDLDLDLGIEIDRKFSQNSSLGIYGLVISDFNPKGSFKIHPAHTSNAQFTGWTGETGVSLIQQFGNTRYNTWAWYAPKAMRREVSRGEDGRLQTNDVAFDCVVQDDALASAVDAALYLAVG